MFFKFYGLSNDFLFFYPGLIWRVLEPEKWTIFVCAPGRF